MGGTTGEDPVAITNRRALMRYSPASTVSPSTKRPAAVMTLHAEAGEAFDGIVRRDRGDDVVHVVVHGARIDQGIDGRDAERRRVAHQVRALARGQQRLRRHAAVVQAIAAHLVLFDEDDALAEGRGGRGDRKPARARADDAEVDVQNLALLRSAERFRNIFRHCGLSIFSGRRE